MTKAYIELTNNNFDKTVSEGVVMVDFWAPWCGPCKMIGPIIEELAMDFKDKAKITKVNTDEEKELVVRFGVRTIPTILFFKDGEMVEQMIGAASKETFAEKINTLL
jgi:thioredoxin 1